MAFDWLPDAEHDPHPRLTWFGEYCFDLVISRLYRIDSNYPPDYRLAPGTLVVSNHLRDADVPILACALCRREGVRINWPMPFFASREDLFRPDFLDEYLQGWPQPLRSLLGRLPLAWLFRIMRAEPIRRVREFTLADAFSELPKTHNLVHWLNHRGRNEIETNTPNQDKPPEHRDWGLRRLHGQARQTLAPDFRATVAGQLQHLAELLDAGRMVYLAPEGRNSRDGRFGRIRAGVWQLVQRTASPPPILPLSLSYDALQPGRLRAVVQVGRPQQAYATTRRNDFDAALEQTIRRLYPLNMSHLTSRFLANGPATFSTNDFAEWIDNARGQLVSAELNLDHRLSHANCHDTAERRLNWLQRKHVIKKDRGGWRNHWPDEAQPGWDRPENIIRYCDNALEDHLQALAPHLSLKP